MGYPDAPRLRGPRGQGRRSHRAAPTVVEVGSLLARCSGYARLWRETLDDQRWRGLLSDARWAGRRREGNKGSPPSQPGGQKAGEKDRCVGVRGRAHVGAASRERGRAGNPAGPTHSSTCNSSSATWRLLTAPPRGAAPSSARRSTREAGRPPRRAGALPSRHRWPRCPAR